MGPPNARECENSRRSTTSTSTFWLRRGFRSTDIAAPTGAGGAHDRAAGTARRAMPQRPDDPARSTRAN